MNKLFPQNNIKGENKQNVLIKLSVHLSGLAGWHWWPYVVQIFIS